MRNPARLSFTLLFLAAGAGVASAQVGTSVNTVGIEARHSGKCVDVSAWSHADGGRIQQYTCNGYDNQRFDLIETADAGFFNIVGLDSGKCLDVEAASQASGAKIHQWSCHGGDNQKFRLAPSTDGFYTLVAKHSGKCVDVAAWGLRPGAQIQQWDCHGYDNQKFSFTGDDLGLANKFVELRPRHTEAAAANMCVDIDGYAQAAGARVKLSGCHAGSNQRFRLAMTPRGAYRFVTEHSGHFFSLWAHNDGAWVSTWTSFPGNQEFTLRDAGGGFYEVVSDLSGKCMAVAGASQAEGAQIHQWTCGGDSKQFQLRVDAAAGIRARDARIAKAYRPRLMMRYDHGCHPLPFTGTYDHQDSCKSTFDPELAVFASVKKGPSGREAYRVTYGVAFGVQPGFFGGRHGYDAQYLVVDIVDDQVTSVWADLHQGSYTRVNRALHMDGDHVKAYVGQYFNSLKLEAMTTGAIWENWGDPTGSDRQASGRLVMADDVCRAPDADYRSADGKVYSAYDRGKLADYIGCDNAADPWKNDDDKAATFRSKSQYKDPYGLAGCVEGEEVWMDIDFAGADICNASHFSRSAPWTTSRSYKNLTLDGFVAGATYVDHGAGSPFRQVFSPSAWGWFKHVTIRTGARVDYLRTISEDLLGGEIDQSFGGDGGGAQTIDGLVDDPIVSVELCTARKNVCTASDLVFGCTNYRDVARVGHIKLITRNGRMIEGGGGYESCTTIAPGGKRLYGFYGREGDEIDVLGTIWGDL